MQENDAATINTLQINLDEADEQKENLKLELDLCHKEMQSNCNELETQLSQRRKQFEDREQELKHLKGLVSDIRQDKEHVILQMQTLKKDNMEKERKCNQCQMQISEMQHFINKMGDENTYLCQEADRLHKKCKDLEQQICNFKTQEKQQGTTLNGIEVSFIFT
ncbi:uncharacterized protein [Ambystoma mexicanum]|uniref:uncharacterized protein n=1 Tax=Ambystoma mexicanum TaxID=8296 RepID=UPI0037E9679A